MVKMTEERLVQLCKKHRSSAQKKVYATYSPQFRAVCKRYVIEKYIAEDLLQESFVKIFFSVDKFEWKGEGSFESWMRRIVINMSINYLKKTKKSILIEPIENDNIIDFNLYDDDGFFESSLTRFSKDDVNAAFGEVPEKFRVVLNMAILDGLRHKEIADILGIAEETSRSRLTRGKKIFKDILIRNTEKPYSGRAIKKSIYN